jgi:hypothetical protein
LVLCRSLALRNARNKLRYNNQPYICKYYYDNNKKQFILIYDLKENQEKTSFTFNDEHILDYYYADGLFFVTLIDEHIHHRSTQEHHNQFPEPKNHRLQIYDVESKKLLHTQKFPLPEKYVFGNYNYLLDYADPTGCYLYHFPSKAIIHYIKTNTFDIKDEPAIQQAVTDDNNPNPPQQSLIAQMKKIFKNNLFYNKTVLFLIGLSMIILLVHWGLFQKSPFDSYRTASFYEFF